MGDEDTDQDSIWTTAPEAPDDPSPSTEASADTDTDTDTDAHLWGALTPEGDPDDLWGPAERAGGEGGGRSRVRTALGVGCLVIAAIAAAIVLTGNDDAGTKGSTKTATMAPSDSSVLGADVEATTEPKGAAVLVPSTVPEGAVVKCGDWDQAASFAPDPLPEGVAIWSDFDGWHVRATGTGVGTVTGRITGTVAPNLLPQIESDRVEATVPPEGSELFFTIQPGEESVGFDFTAGCTQQALGFELKSDAQPMDPSVIHLGKRGGVEGVPFIVSRIPEPS